MSDTHSSMDRTIDAIAAHLTDAAPPVDLRARVTARLRPHAGTSSWILSAARARWIAAGLAATVAGFVSIKSLTPSHVTSRVAQAGLQASAPIPTTPIEKAAGAETAQRQIVRSPKAPEPEPAVTPRLPLLEAAPIAIENIHPSHLAIRPLAVESISNGAKGSGRE